MKKPRHGTKEKRRGDNGSFPTENLVLAVWYSDWKSTAGPQFQSNPEECWGPAATERETEIENTDDGQESRKGPQAAAGKGATNLQM